MRPSDLVLGLGDDLERLERAVQSRASSREKAGERKEQLDRAREAVRLLQRERGEIRDALRRIAELEGTEPA